MSVICQLIVNENDDSEKCNAMYDVSPPALCQNTCNQQVQAVKTLVQSQCQSTMPSTTLSNYIDTYSQQCLMDPALNATASQSCMLGMVNEPDYCGFPSQGDGCNYCQSSAANGDLCCSKIACDGGAHGLSKGAVAGIVIAIVSCLLLLVAAVFYYRRSKSVPQVHYQSADDRTETACIGEKLSTAPSFLSGTDYQTHDTITPAALRDTDSVGLISKLDNEFHTVIHQYYPSQPDELSLRKNDIIVSTVAFDDGWGVGVNITTGQKGAFPLICVTPASREVLDWLLNEVEQNVDESASVQLCEIIRYQMRHSPPLRRRQGTKIPHRSQSIHSQSYLHKQSSQSSNTT
ncbi:hypothetical protein INT44_008256 [Umbelopsis vinacea]|uniref:SH3 domain-containing protein n=1 Tax=Umbelopsis vinacea TaxID=44442 RepID=A0A8H7PWB1_9FUNG|nr:hypothetical protein INT44_008256 [Umbelopsis vinacea]